MLLFAAIPGTALGYSYLGATCDGTAIGIHLEIFNDLDPSFEGLAIVVKQNEVGTCASEVVLATPPLAMPAYASGYAADFTVTAPQTDLYYAISAYVVLPDGTHHYLFWASHEAGCGRAIAGRGYLSAGNPLPVFTPCATACWDGVLSDGGTVDPSALSLEQYQWAVGTGIAVDLYGTATPPGGFPDTPDLILFDVQPVPDGDCDAVGTQVESWGSFKARYR